MNKQLTNTIKTDDVNLTLIAVVVLCWNIWRKY